MGFKWRSRPVKPERKRIQESIYFDTSLADLIKLAAKYNISHDQFILCDDSDYDSCHICFYRLETDEEFNKRMQAYYKEEQRYTDWLHINKERVAEYELKKKEAKEKKLKKDLANKAKEIKLLKAESKKLQERILILEAQK